jgi:hypothetical protein
VEEIAAHQHEIDLFADGVFPQNIDPGIEKIARAFGQLVPRASEMHIGNVEELHTSILPQRRGGTEQSPIG